MGVEVPSNPINRKEQYLAKIAGQAVEIPAEPLTREEAYLDEIAKNGSGGGGGTTNYNLLSNKPQIAGTELQGNKSLADLGIASASDLAAKQDALTAGDYIVIKNDKISVSKLKQGELDLYSYEFVSTDTSHTPKVKVIKKVNGETISETVYDEFQAANWMTFDDIIRFRYDASDSYKWKYQCLVTSNEHVKDTVVSWYWNQAVDYTETFDVGASAITDLVTKGDMNEALAGKQDKYETITYAQWQALTPAQQAAKDYYISDYPSSVLTAGNIAYDNTTSGMTANKVQGAIDELKGGLTNVKTTQDQANYDSATDINSATKSNPFVAPTDGYVRVKGTGFVGLTTSDGSGDVTLLDIANVSLYPIFVKKGAKVYSNGTFEQIKFIALA